MITRGGPPRDDEGRANPADVEAAATTPPTTNTAKRTAKLRVCSGATPLGRRRLAEQRCAPLHDGARDPWQPWRPEKLSEVHVQAAVDAAHHLLAANLPAVFDRDTLRAMWRAGHRELITELLAS